MAEVKGPLRYAGDGTVRDAARRPVAYIAAWLGDIDDANGRVGRAARFGHLLAAAPDLYVACHRALAAIDDNEELMLELAGALAKADGEAG